MPDKRAREARDTGRLGHEVARALKATAAIVSENVDVDGALRWAVEIVCDCTGWPLGHIFTVDADGQRLTSDDIWSDDDPDRHAAFVKATTDAVFHIGEGLPGRILATGEPAWITDVRADPNFPRANAAAQVGLGAGFGFPIISARGVEGVMEFFSPDPVEPNDELLDLVAHVGRQLGHLIDRARADAALRASELRLAESERVGRAGSWSWDVGATSVTWSDELYRIYGVDPTAAPVTFDQYLACIHPDDRPRVVEQLQQILETSVSYEHEYRIVQPDGTVRWVHARVAIVAEADGAPRRLAGHCQDVTERHVAEDARNLAQLELESHQRILNGIARAEPVVNTLEELCTDVEARYDGVRCSILLVDEDQGVLRHVAAPSLPASFRRAIDGLPIAIGAGACGTAAARNEPVVVADTLADPLTADFVDLARAHDLLAVWSHPLTTSAGQVIGTFAMYRATPYEPDESEIRTVMTAGSLAALALERWRTQADLVKAASIDPLTGLSNRAYFLEDLEARLREPDSTVAVMFLDLDGFKWINDSLGHPSGDQILREVADRLDAVLDPRLHLARFGGDEFTVLVPGMTYEEVERVADAIDAAFEEPFELDGREFFLSCCVGIAVNDHASDAYGLIRDADAAMYSAKEVGRARHALFDARLRERAMGRVTLESELRRAIERDEFVMHYQPIIDLRSGAWVGAEALVRWQHPRRGLVPPLQFIPLAEENGLIVPLGLAIVRKVIADRASWDVTNGIYTSLNLSVVQLADPSIGVSVGSLLRDFGVPPELLVVEVTETAVMQQLDIARTALEQISDLGVRVMIDDFGAGYSSIARLGELPMAAIKIDNSFTASLGTEPKAAKVVGAIADLAHALELEVVVEGIETAAARSAARDLGCEFGQGYHLARPMPGDDLQALLRAAPNA